MGGGRVGRGGQARGHMRRRNITYTGYAEAYLSEGFDVPQVDIMWGSKIVSLASLANVYSNIPPLMGRGRRKGDRRGRARGEGLSSREISFSPQNSLKNVGSPNLLAILAVAASRRGMEKS